MSVFEIEGTAKKRVACDIALIEITFRNESENNSDNAIKVLDECDSFLKELTGIGMDLKDVHFSEDNVSKSRYGDNPTRYAERVLSLRIPFDMKAINSIQSILIKGKYSYELNIDGDISDMGEQKIELAKQALLNSKHEAEQLAEILGIKVKGIESIRKNRWDDDDDEGIVHYRGCFEEESYRPSDNIGAKTIEVSEELKVKWILE